MCVEMLQFLIVIIFQLIKMLIIDIATEMLYTVRSSHADAAERSNHHKKGQAHLQSKYHHCYNHHCCCVDIFDCRLTLLLLLYCHILGHAQFRVFHRLNICCHDIVVLIGVVFGCSV